MRARLIALAVVFSVVVLPGGTLFAQKVATDELLSAVVQVNEALERLVARELSEAGDPLIELEPRNGLTSDALAP